MPIDVLNPTTGEEVNRYDAIDAQEIEERFDTAGITYAAWQQTNIDAREAYLRDAAAILEKNKKRYAGLMNLRNYSCLIANRQS